jgi:predicted amidohydrolase YtcJ
MTIEEAVEGFTMDAAYASFEEENRGSIEAGKLADFTILDQDIFTVQAKAILHTKVIYTIVGGEIVYQAEDQTPFSEDRDE